MYHSDACGNKTHDNHTSSRAGDEAGTQHALSDTSFRTTQLASNE